MRLVISGLAFCALAGAQTSAPNPDPASTPLTHAYDSLRARDYDKAIASFEKAIAAAPARPSIRKDFAYTLLKAGENEAASDQFAEALRLDRNDLHIIMRMCAEAHPAGNGIIIQHP